MTINKAIEKASRLHPDALDDDVKAGWISELDGKIALETMHKSDFKPYAFPNDAEAELLVRAPYDTIYELYIIAMSDFTGGEIGSYAASAAMFNKAYEEFRKQYIRTNMPPQTDITL